MQYRDELPDGCPGDFGAAEIKGALTVYHAVHSPIDWARDFRSFATEMKERRGEYKAGGAAKDCISRGLSVHLSREAAERNLQRWQSKNAKKWAGKQICKVELSAGAGAILRTIGGQPVERGDHWTWWPAHDFDLRTHTELL